MGRRPLCVCLLFFLAVYLTVCQVIKAPDLSGRQEFDGEPLVLCGVVEDIYEPLAATEDSTILYLKQIEFQTSSVDEISNDLYETEKTGAVCYLSDGQRPARVGATVQIAGKAYSFSAATNPGEFDMAFYYELRGYQLKMYDAVVEAQSASYDERGQFFYQLRNRIAEIFVLCLGEKNGGLASAMVLGRKKDVSDAVKALYQGAGISHILAISGLHISMVGGGVSAILKKMRMPMRAAGVLALLLVCGYGAFVGMGVSTLRAMIMFSLGLIAGMLYRTPDVFTSLAVAATAVLVQDAGYLYDSGFQLSFSAILGIAAVAPVLKDRGLRRRETPGFWRSCLDRAWEGFCVSLGVALAMMPWLLSSFYTWNPWSLLFNPIAVFLTGLLLPMLFVLAGAGLLLSGGMGAWKMPELTGSMGVLGMSELSGGMNALEISALRILALPARALFELLEWASRLIQKLPGSCLHIGMPKVWQLVIFGIGLAAMMALGKRVRPAFRMAAAAAMIGVFLVRLPGTLTVTMLDVGQGAGYVVQTPDHQTYLLDCGSSSRSGVGEYRIVPFLKYSGTRKLDAVFISHWDEDHVNGLEEVLDWAEQERVAVGRIILPDTALEDAALEKLLALAKEYGIPTARMGAGARWEKGKLRILCLHPYGTEEYSDRNASSLLLKLEWEAFGALFPGDLEAEQEAWICENYGAEILSCQLLAAGHHGSSTSSTEAFLEATDPAAALISCGKNNSYGHPHAETLERFAQQKIRWYTTADCGAVTVRVKKNEMRIERFLD